MKLRATFLIWSAILAFAAIGQTHSLSPLVTTNKPGDYQLPTAWTGIAKVTARTGWFATKNARKETDELLRFDMFTARHSLESRSGTRFIWEDSGRVREGRRMGHIHENRASLPPDSELLASDKLSSLTNLFGASHEPTDGWGKQTEMHSTVGWRYFSLGRSNTIETLSVFCMVTHRRSQSDSDINSIIVRRGLIRPTTK